MTVTQRPADQRDVLGLGRPGDVPAVVRVVRGRSPPGRDRLGAERCARLGDTRRLVLVECANALEPLVTYLAALRGRHPVLLVPAPDGAAPTDAWQRIMAGYDPDVVLRRGPSGWTLEEKRDGTRHDLHPELALLLGTSGSTGTPKLVRLSRENLRSNAAAIALYLHLGPDSRAATTLPIHYCYGLSVVNSHLWAGGSVWLTDQSVVDEGFWAGFERAGATSFAGVPYTFELLERADSAWADQPGLRQVTQAGGRLAPERVRELALSGRRRGFEFVVMYGQTEATARMAYLPPHLAAERPSAIGIPIDGGELSIDDGELVYRGPNVMLGYAESAADLALGRTTTELRTGDLAVQHEDGLYELVGRRSRIAKLFGTRLDLDLVERLLAEQGLDARVVSDDRDLRVFLRSDDAVAADRVVRTVTQAHCLPAHAVRVDTVSDFPRTSSGKVDHAALAAGGPRTSETDADRVGANGVRSAYRVVFGHDVRDTDTFVGLGGDSLSYVEMVVRLERAIGALPSDWPRRTVAELSALRRGRSRWLRHVEVPLLLRAVAITLIVGSHVELFDLMGGAHVLLVLFGFNLARFALSAPSGGQRVRGLLRSVRELALPAVVWIGGVALLDGKYDAATALLLNNLLGSDEWNVQWQFWFLESALWTTLALVAVVQLPGVARVVDRQPLLVASLALAATLAWRELAPDHTTAEYYYSIGRSAWCVALGWVIHSARDTRQRWFATVLVPATLHGFFPDDHPREWLVMAGVVALVWAGHVVVPRPLDRVVTWVGGASLFVYLTHWMVYPHLEEDHQVLAWLASMALGIVVWRGYAAARRILPRSWRVARSAVRTTPGRSRHPVTT
jgi:acyl-CoA synthetase (AMP-forming)/AMP-acid ligase II